MDFLNGFKRKDCPISIGKAALDSMEFYLQKLLCNSHKSEREARFQLIKCNVIIPFRIRLASAVETTNGRLGWQLTAPRLPILICMLGSWIK